MIAVAPNMFRAELMDALRIVERGDLAPAEMRGAWAGELGQTQFMPSSWMKYAVDFDGNGRRDLLHNAPDVLASTANYLAGYGWQRGKDWQPGSRILRYPAMEQERGLLQDHRLFRDPARACPLKAPDRTRRADRTATGPLLAQVYFAHGGVHRLVQVRAAHTHLAVEQRVLRSAISFCATNLPSPSAMSSIAVSGLLQVGRAAAAHAVLGSLGRTRRRTRRRQLR